ncbi:MAG: hypothetical protein ATN36_02745 [Epulopiscium sp. Nele67-Bin005]|nr:MAG: hypothetical protein ATN36_02745 [Epulopiscium sp. Nele67-Bin005]
MNLIVIIYISSNIWLLILIANLFLVLVKDEIYDSQDFYIKLVYYTIFCVLFIGTLYAFISSFITGLTLNKETIIRTFILIVTNTILLIIDDKLHAHIKIKNEKSFLEQQNKVYENELKIIHQSNDIIKNLKHDMKNHLFVLQNLYTSGQHQEIEAYISTMVKQMDNGVFCNSGNFIIDSIINFKLGTIEKATISVNITIPDTLNIDNYTLTTILGNLLDNAIFALNSSHLKKLDINISYVMGNLVIMIDNSYNGVINNNLTTTKANKENHGVGLSSVRNCINNCEGELEISYDEEIFSVSIIIPA